MINILMVNKLFYPVIGGMEITITQLCESIAKDSNFKVSVLAGNEKIFSKSITYLWKNASIHKLRSFGVLLSTPITFNYPLALKKMIKENDVFHFHVPNPIGDISFLLTKIPSNKKVIVTVHADVSQTQKKILAPIYNYILKKLLNRADIITTSAPENTKNFSILKNYQQKCINIPLAYNQSHVCKVTDEEKIAFKQKVGLDNSKKTVLFVGRLVYYKGLSFLIEAIKSLENLQLIIVGEGNLAALHKHQANTEQLAGRIFFTGKLPDNVLPAAYSIADIFVLPSIKQAETFGIVQAEAMAYGLPIVNTYLNTGVNFVSIHNETGLTVPTNDSFALQNAIQKITSNTMLWKKYSTSAKRRAELFTPENMVEGFKKLYR